MRNPFRLLLFFWLCLLAVSGHSHDQFVTDPDLNPGNLVPETIEYLRSDRQLTLAEVEGLDEGDGVDREDRQSDSAQQQAHSMSEHRWRSIAAQDANFGFDLGYYWFRYPIRTPDGADENWLLEVGYPLLDHLTVYLVQNQRVIQQYNSGDRQPFDLRPEAYPNFLFPFQLKPRQQYWLYVELQTSSSVQAPMSLRSKADFWKTHLTEKIFLIIFLCRPDFDVYLQRHPLSDGAGSELSVLHPVPWVVYLFDGQYGWSGLSVPVARQHRISSGQCAAIYECGVADCAIVRLQFLTFDR